MTWKLNKNGWVKLCFFLYKGVPSDDKNYEIVSVNYAVTIQVFRAQHVSAPSPVHKQGHKVNERDSWFSVKVWFVGAN